MAVLQYLKDNVHRIPKIGSQSIGLWTKEAIEKYITLDKSGNITGSEGRQMLHQIIEQYSPKELQRDQVILSYKEDSYKGYIATLLWGGL